MGKPVYQGAFDLLPHGKLAWSVSQLLTDYDGPLIRINGRDLGPDNRGLLPLGRVSRWLDGDEGRVDVLYDQSGTQAHIRWSDRPLLTLAGQGGRPEISGGLGATTTDGQPIFTTATRGPTFESATDQLSYLMV